MVGKTPAERDGEARPGATDPSPAIGRAWRPALPRSTRGLLLLLLALALVPVLFVQSLVYYDRFQTRRAEELQANLEVARAVAVAFDAYVQDVLRQELAVGVVLTSRQPLPPDEVERLLVANASANPALRDLAWIDPEGRIVASTVERVVGTLVGDRPHFRQVVEGQEWVVSDLFQSGVDGQPVFAVVRGIHDDRGTLQGVVFATVDANRLGRVLHVERARGGAISVVDRNGYGVYRWPEVEWTWESRNWLPTQPIIREALDGREATGTFVSLIDGRVRITGMAPIRSIGWAASGSRDEEEAMSPVVRLLYRDVGLLFGVAATSTVVAVIVSRHLTRPVKRLRSHALRLAEGRLEERIEADGTEDLVSLAAALNSMAEAIESREKLLRESEERARHQLGEIESIYDSAHVGLCVFDRQLRYVRVNDRLAAMNGIPAADHIGRTPREIVPSVAPAVEDLAQRIFATGEGASDVQLNGTTAARPDVPGYWVEQWMPLKDAAGQVIGINVVVEDVTERKRAEAERERLLAQLRDVNEQLTVANLWAKDAAEKAEAARAEAERQAEKLRAAEQTRADFLRAITHDLRGPLTSILGYAQMLGRLADNPEAVRKCAETIVTSSRRMNSMLADLVESARLESGETKLNPRAVDLGRLILDLRDRLVTPEQAPRVRIEAVEGLPAVVADPEQIERIVANLISNALKYSEDEVVVTLARGGSEVVVSVSDRGPGIARGEQPKLFERYYRGDAQRGREGLGLGLYISRMLVEAQGGRIWVESEVGQGSTFRFSLPVAS